MPYPFDSTLFFSSLYASAGTLTLSDGTVRIVSFILDRDPIVTDNGEVQLADGEVAAYMSREHAHGAKVNDVLAVSDAMLTESGAEILRQPQLTVLDYPGAQAFKVAHPPMAFDDQVTALILSRNAA